MGKPPPAGRPPRSWEPTHPLGAPVTVEEDGGGALVHLMARVPPGVVHLQQAVLVRHLPSEETCSERTGPKQGLAPPCLPQQTRPIP